MHVLLYASKASEMISASSTDSIAAMRLLHNAASVSLTRVLRPKVLAQCSFVRLCNIVLVLCEFAITDR
jgi:hypothetical protein